MSSADAGTQPPDPKPQQPFDVRRACVRKCGAQLAFHRHPPTDSLIGALGQLRRALGGQKATLL